MKNTHIRILSVLAMLTTVLSFGSSHANPVGQTGSFNQEQAIAQLKTEIAGKENQPAEQVFKNIQMLKGMPAARVLAVISRLLEVSGGRLHPLSCPGSMGKGRQANKADHPGDVRNG